MRGRVGVPAPGFEQVYRTFSQRLDATARAPLAVALSGGGDSAALLVLASRWANRHGRPLVALSVDHGLSPLSGEWMRAAEVMARRCGARFQALLWTGEKPARNLQAEARAARHRLLAAAARAAGAEVLLLGHTADDVLEGEVMRLDGVKNLGRLRTFAPSPVWPEGRGIFVLRPLLEARRLTLRELLLAEGVQPIEDPANGDLRYARARARRALAEGRYAPLPPSLDPPPTAGAEEVREGAAGELHIPARALALGGARLLAQGLLAAGGREAPPRRADLDRALQRLPGPGALSLSGARLVAAEGAVLICREAGEYRRAGRPSLRLEAGEAVFDGRFLVRSDAPARIEALQGLAARLAPEDRNRLRRFSPEVRSALPVEREGEAVRLPRPLGEGRTEALCLAGRRLIAAAGLVQRERDISRKTMAKEKLTSYVDRQAL